MLWLKEMSMKIVVNKNEVKKKLNVNAAVRVAPAVGAAAGAAAGGLRVAPKNLGSKKIPM